MVNKNKYKKDESFFEFIHNQIMSMNNSKFFAGLVIISLNVASKFVTLKLSKTTETYLKYTFSRQILIFAMAWMATRDIYMALILTAVFVILADYLFNENSSFCCFTDDFKKHYLTIDNTNMTLNTSNDTNTGLRTIQNPPNENDIKHAMEILEQVKQQQDKNNQPNYITPFSVIK